MYENVGDIEGKYHMSEFPLNVIVEVGNHCNLNCTTCINDKLTRPKGFMSMTLYRKIIDEIHTVVSPPRSRRPARRKALRDLPGGFFRANANKMLTVIQTTEYRIFCRISG